MMDRGTLVRRSLRYYWRTHLAVVLGVATGVAVLAGALLVGDSVRASLRDLVLARLGRTDYVVSAGGLFREQLAGTFPGAAPLLALEGAVVHQESGRRSGNVEVYGVDERFWQFHGLAPQPLATRDMLLSAGLAAELGSKNGDGLLVRLERASAVPAESLHGRKEQLALTIRFDQKEVLRGAELGEFSLRPRQGASRSVFVPLRTLQVELNQPGRANTILVSASPESTGRLEAALRSGFALEDLGVKLRALDSCRCLALESDGIVVGEALGEAARHSAGALGWQSAGVFTYLANDIRSGGREVPYSLVAAVEPAAFGALAGGAEDAIVLNEWAARDLGARPGDAVTLDYYLWDPSGRLLTRSAQFRLAGVTPIAGLAADRNLAPEYPGITESEDISDWDPPFPIDLKKVRPRDEDYWRRYRTTPKAFLVLGKGQELWQSRYGKLTSVRIFPPATLSPAAALDSYRARLREALDPVRAGLTVIPVRAQGLEAARGATDFGEYFVYFSFFLVVSALLLASLFFKLSVEQRLREVGTLRAVGFSLPQIHRLYLREGLALAALGTAMGLAGAVAYASLLLLGLRTWWVDAVGTQYLTLHISGVSLLAGGLGGLLAAAGCIAWTLRSLRRLSPRSLLAGTTEESHSGHAGRRRRVVYAGLAAGVAGLGLLVAAAAGAIDQTGGFFGAGTLLLAALLCLEWWWLARRGHRLLSSALALGYRNAAYRPGRSVLSITLIASAIFILVAVSAFQHPEGEAPLGRKSASGGFPLLAEAVAPLVYDLNRPEGRDSLNIPDLPEGTQFTRFRLRPGDDTSCLNLYEPRNPRILGAPADFLRAGRFSFASSLAKTPEQQANPWLLLEAPQPDGAIAAVADANSLAYVLHRRVGDEFVIQPESASPIRLRIVGALERGLFQGEFLISEARFLRLFPELPGYRFFLIDAPASETGRVTDDLESALSDYGFDVLATGERLAAFNRVENTYLSTFQALGGLGLLLGTIGLAAILLRNVLERRRELALLRAVGYRPANLALIVVAENAALLLCGVATGGLCAALAIAPAFLARHGAFPGGLLAILLLGVVATGMAASLAAVAAAVRSPLLAALRAE